MPFKLPTTTPTPDELFDVWLQNLSEGELKVLLYIIRRTLGFRKVVDAISYQQFLHGITTREGVVLDRGCLKNSTSLSKALAGLERKGLIKTHKASSEDGDKEVSLYSLFFEGDQLIEDPRALGATPNVVPRYAKRSTPTTPNVVRVLRQTSLQETEEQQTVNKRVGPAPRSITSGRSKGAKDYTGGSYGVCAECGCNPHDASCSLASGE